MDETVNGGGGGPAASGDEGVVWPALAREGDTARPNVARMYDHLLGGAHNFAVDRDAAARLAAANPDTHVEGDSRRR